MKDDYITVDQLTDEEVKKNIIQAFKDFIPNAVVSFYDDDSFPEEINQDDFVNDSINVVADNVLAIGNYISRSDLIFDCFCLIVDHGGEKIILDKIYGDKKPSKYIVGCSHMIHKAWLMCLVDILMSFYGFYLKFEDTVHLEMYSRVFHMAFHEYDDHLRNRLSRRDLYSELVRWDRRNKEYFAVEKLPLRREGMPELSEKEKENRHKLFVACKEEFEKYPFAGEKLLGTFVSGYGFFAPGEKTPTYVKVVEDYSRTQKAIEAETNSEMKKLLRHAYLNYHFSTFTLLKYLNDNIARVEPRLSKLRFIKAEKDANGDKILILTDEYYTASLPEIIVDRARMYSIMDLPIADLVDTTPKTMEKIFTKESKEDEENNGNS